MPPSGRLNRSRLASAALLALLAAVMLACGGSDGEDVREDITQALTTTDEDDCRLDTFATKRFVDQQTYSIPELASEAEKICRDDVKTYASDAVEVSAVKVDGDRATARIVADGGTFGFGALGIALVKDGDWKFDELTALDIDRKKFNQLQIQFSSVGDEQVSAPQTACTLRRLDRFSDTELEQAVLKADVKLVVDPLLVCFLRPELRKGGLSLRQTSCVLKALRNDGVKLLRVALREDEGATQALLAQAAAGCGGGITA